WGDDASTPEEMFFLRQEPMAAIRMKFMTGSHSAFRVSVGFNGGIINYREYVADDAALFFNPLSEDVVTDRIRANYTNGNIALGMEFSCGNRLRFFGGFSLVYAYGGGKMKFSYGNEITDLNPAPTTMKKIDGTGGINDFAATVQMDYARPVEQYTSGISHGIGLSGDLGVEFFFIPKVSIDARVSMMPIMLAFQPQTYVVYEGLNKFTNKIEDYNRLVSPGSNYLLYGTENYGISFGINYYF
ncbi:MAG: hypothetical protein IJ680_08120, partial [Paludibacteraceae bacterium]|nr:hypothetical protein [Paludibacteraceae bacterium]